MRPRVDERGQASTSVRPRDRIEDDQSKCRAADDREVAKRNPGCYEQSAGNEGDHHRSAEIGLGDNEQAGGADDHEQWPAELTQVVHTLWATREQSRGVENERQLQQLGGLELEWAAADPAAGAVDANADMRDVHGEHEHERDGEQRRY